MLPTPGHAFREEGQGDGGGAQFRETIRRLVRDSVQALRWRTCTRAHNMKSRTKMHQHVPTASLGNACDLVACVRAFARGGIVCARGGIVCAPRVPARARR